MAMAWRKSPDALVQRFSELVPDDPRVERRKMFGYPAAFLGGNLFMSLYQDSLILRLSEADRGALLKVEGASLFEPMPGRPMREYVVVPRWLLDSPGPLGRWIGRSLAYAGTIPAKSAGRPKKPATAPRARRPAAGKTRRRT
jgi:TfoX/Sxy family transcriptional regulator of competence genes